MMTRSLFLYSDQVHGCSYYDTQNDHGRHVDVDVDVFASISPMNLDARGWNVVTDQSKMLLIPRNSREKVAVARSKDDDKGMPSCSISCLVVKYGSNTNVDASVDFSPSSPWFPPFSSSWPWHVAVEDLLCIFGSRENVT
jgi:hypothetical protein